MSPQLGGFNTPAGFLSCYVARAGWRRGLCFIHTLPPWRKAWLFGTRGIGRENGRETLVLKCGSDPSFPLALVSATVSHATEPSHGGGLFGSCGCCDSSLYLGTREKMNRGIKTKELAFHPYVYQKNSNTPKIPYSVIVTFGFTAKAALLSLMTLACLYKKQTASKLLAETQAAHWGYVWPPLLMTKLE